MVTDAGRAYIWVVRDRRARRVAVRAGRDLEGRREILEGIEAGATVIIGPPAGLAEGIRVKVDDGG